MTSVEIVNLVIAIVTHNQGLKTSKLRFKYPQLTSNENLDEVNMKK